MAKSGKQIKDLLRKYDLLDVDVHFARGETVMFDLFD